MCLGLTDKQPGTIYLCEVCNQIYCVIRRPYPNDREVESIHYEDVNLSPSDLCLVSQLKQKAEGKDYFTKDERNLFGGCN